MAAVIPKDACALRPVRLLPNGQLRLYETVEFLSDQPSGVCAMYYQRCKVFGGIAKTNDEVGVCDVLNKDGDIIADFPLSRKGLSWLCKALGTRIDKAWEKVQTEDNPSQSAEQ